MTFLHPKCSICQLPDEKRAAVEDALRAQMPYQVLAVKTGLSKASLWRHGRHTDRAVDQGSSVSPEVVPKAAAQKTEIRALATRPPAPIERKSPAKAAIAQEAARELAEQRTRFLWNENIAGLEAAKQVPGAMREQALFLRGALGVTELDARLAGLFDTAASHVTVNQIAVIMMPKDLDSEAQPVIDVPPISEQEYRTRSQRKQP